MVFEPPRCPYPACAASAPAAHYAYILRGFYSRKCDGRWVQRYRCLTCKLSFSDQTFRVDYRYRKPHLDGPIFDAFVSKVTHRQSARALHTTRKTVERRLRRYGEHARLFHQARVLGKKLAGVFQLDEAETFETDRRLQPVTLPVLIERDSRFFVHVETAPLPARKASMPALERRLRDHEARHGKRTSGSRAAVKHCFEALARLHDAKSKLLIQTDMKATYPVILREVFGEQGFVHQQTHSKVQRDHDNPLFAINHTLAMLRDGLSRLVRRTWAHAKLRARLELQTWIYVLWRNYVRYVTNQRKQESPAMIVGVEQAKWTRSGVLGWSARFPELLHVH